MTVAELAADMRLPGNPSGRRGDVPRQDPDPGGAGLGWSRPAPFEIVPPDADPDAAIEAIGLPCVVKPADDTGSANVRLCHSPAEVTEQIAAIRAVAVNVRGQTTTRTALVEEYVDGPEYSVETFSVHGTPTLIGITAKRVSAPPHFVETGHVFPAPIPADIADDMWNATQHALKAVGYEWGPAHTEVRIDADGWVRVIEINARLAGGMIPELVRASIGVDLLDQQLAATAGQPLDLAGQRGGYAGIRFLVADSPGVFRGADGLDAARDVPGVTTVELRCAPGTDVRPATNAYDRLGFVIATAETPDGVEAALREAVARITLVIDRPTS